MPSSWRWAALSVCFVICLLGWQPFVDPALAESPPDIEAAEVASTDQCWVFGHLQKCGGTTVKNMLQHVWKSKYFIYDSGQWKVGSRNLKLFATKFATGEKWNVMTGGYTEALRRSKAVDEKCQWFTLFRNPIARMVSAYYYCQELPGDVACASEVVKAKELTLEGFAKHWGNFALRQFALSLVSADDVIAYSRTDEAKQKLPQVEDLSKLPGWYLLKMYLDAQPQMPANLDIVDSAMYGMLQPVQDLLRDRFAAVGVLEEFNTTLSLFDAALGMPGMSWHQQFALEGKGNVDYMYKKQKKEAMEAAWMNSEIKKHMHLDILLYEHAVDVFRTQVAAYGLA